MTETTLINLLLYWGELNLRGEFRDSLGCIRGGRVKERFELTEPFCISPIRFMNSSRIVVLLVDGEKVCSAFHYEKSSSKNT